MYAWFPIPPTVPKGVIDNINRLVDLQVMERLNDEIRFRHEFTVYYDKASNAVDKDPEAKKMIADEYSKGGFDCGQCERGRWTSCPWLGKYYPG
jgi:hypothetical protein